MMGISLRRTLLIARRDFFGYVKTFGFWITVLSPFFGIALGLFITRLSLTSEPLRYVTILDDTGRYEARIDMAIASEREGLEREMLKQSARLLLTPQQRGELNDAIETGGVKAGRAYIETSGFTQFDKIKIPDRTLYIVPAPADTLDGLMPYIKGETQISVQSQNGDKAHTLSGALHIVDDESGQPKSSYWTVNPSAQNLSRYINRLLEEESDAQFFEGTGKAITDLWRTREAMPQTQILNPNKPAGEDGSGQGVTIADRIPNFVAAAFSAFLWLAIFSGAYMLLMSMVEEKINKALEMLLASTRFSEILFGKLIGVAALTIATMLPWMLLGGAGLIGLLVFGDNAMASALSDAVSAQVVGLFVLFFVLGYLFYGALFMAMGALAESMQDAQTLVTPVLILLTLCVMVVPIGLGTPDSGFVKLASFLPPSAPFAVLMRLPTQPPFWEIAVPALILLLSTVFVVWAAERIFRYGILSGGALGGAKHKAGQIMARLLKRKP